MRRRRGTSGRRSATADGRDDADVAALIHAAYNDIRRATECSEERG